MSEVLDLNATGAAAHVPTPLEAAQWPDSVAAWTVNVPPEQAAGVLTVLDADRLSQTGRVDALIAVDRLIAWAHATQARLLAAMAGDQFPDALAPKLEREWVTEDVRAALGESARGARARLREATELVHRLPETLSALQAGRITARHAHALVDTTAVLDDAAAREIQAAVLPDPARTDAPVPDMAAFRRKLRRASIAADPAGAADKAARAAEDRDVWVMPQPDAMAFLGAPLPAEAAATVLAAVEAKAEQIKHGGDERTRAQRRADGLVQLCADYLNPTLGDTGSTGSTGSTAKIEMDTHRTRGGTQAPRYHRLRPHITVCIAASTLLGVDDQPAEVDRIGPIPAEVARRIAADPIGTWRRLVTDDTGRLVDYGRNTYRPPAGLARHVIARDRTCRAPGCNRPATGTDLHHIHPWSHGGTTNAENLTALCERHHYAIHDAGWRVTRHEDGSLDWTSPAGRHYRVPPATYPIDHTTTKIKMDTGDGTEDDTDEASDTGEASDGTEDDTDEASDTGEVSDRPPF
jgi:hypothetical protein